MVFKKLLPVAAATGLIFTAGGASAAEGAKDKSAKQQDTQASILDQQQDQVALQVESVDQQNNTVTFQAPLESNAELKRQTGESLEISELSPGQEVRASFNDQGQVTELEVVEQGAQQPAQPAQPSPSQPSPGQDPMMQDGAEQESPMLDY